MTAQVYHVQTEQLRQFVESIFIEIGLDTSHATTVAQSLVDAELRGKDSHGVIRLAHYVERIETGGMEITPDIDVTYTRDATAIIDGDGGPGQVAAQQAIETGTAIANDSGCGVVGVERSNHFGTVSYYTNQATEEDCIAIGVSHGGPVVTPYGGTEPFLSTNPLCISVPHDKFPVTIDISTSATSLGNVLIAEEEDKEIPSNWAVDDQGSPTTDPAAFNALRPMAGHKGYGLAFIIDVLCGVLISGIAGSSVAGLYDDIESPQDLAHLFVVFDVTAFTDLEMFERRLEELITGIKQVPVRDGFDGDEIYVPGEQAHFTKKRRIENGIPVRSDVWEELASLSESYDVVLPDEQ